MDRRGIRASCGETVVAGVANYSCCAAGALDHKASEMYRVDIVTLSARANIKSASTEISSKRVHKVAGARR